MKWLIHLWHAAIIGAVFLVCGLLLAGFAGYLLDYFGEVSELRRLEAEGRDGEDRVERLKGR